MRSGSCCLSWKKLEWRNCAPPITNERVREIESSLSVVFPNDFRDCVKICHGGTPSKHNFLVPAPLGSFGSCLGYLLNFSKEDEDNIEAILRDMVVRPGELVPFAEDGGGDFICFDYKNT